jgi:MFS transporter
VTTRGWAAPVAAGWAALSVSVVGDQLLDFLLLREVAVDPGRLHVAWLGLAAGLPVLLGGLLGSVVDRSARHLALLFTTAMGVSTAAVLGIWLTWSTAWFSSAVYPLVAVATLMGVLVVTLWNVVLPALVGFDRDRIASAVGTTSILVSLGAAAGPTVGALLVRWFDGRTVVLIDAASFGGCWLLLVGAMRAGSIVRDDPDTKAAPAALSFTAGARLIWSRDRLRWPVVSLAWMNFLLFGTMFVLPMVVRDRGWSTGTLGALMTAMLLGGVAGSLVGKRFRSERHFTAYLAAEPTLRALGLVLFFLAPSGAAGVVAMFLFACPQGLGRVARQSLLITEFPHGERGRVMGSYQMLIRGAMPLAPAATSFGYAHLGTTVFFVGNVAILLTIGVLLALGLSRIGTRPPGSTAAVARFPSTAERRS